MSDLKNLLYEKAREARENAYVPYSGFKVGAAVLGELGKIYQGANIENASYGLTICAERVAITKAVSEGEKKLKAILVIGDTPEPISPCGACRQFMAEFKIETIYLANLAGDIKEFILEQILPYYFTLEKEEN